MHCDDAQLGEDEFRQEPEQQSEKPSARVEGREISKDERLDVVTDCCCFAFLARVNSVRYGL